MDEEFNFLDDSSESSEHANIPRVLTLHEKPKINNNPKRFLAQSITLPNSINKIKKYKNKIEVIKEEEKIVNLKQSVKLTKNNHEKLMINIEDKIHKYDTNFSSNTKTFKYKKVIIKTNNNENGKKRGSCFMKKPRPKLSESIDFNNNTNKKSNKKVLEKKKTNKLESNNKQGYNCNEKRKINSMEQFEICFKKKIIKKNRNKNFPFINLTRNNSKDNFSKETNLETKSKKTMMKTVNFKGKLNKENKTQRFFQSSKILNSFKFDLIKPQKKGNDTNLKLKSTKKITRKLQDFGQRLTLPPEYEEMIKSEKINKISNKENNSKENNSNINTKNKIKSRIIKEKEDNFKINVISKKSSKKIEHFKTEYNNLKQNNFNNNNNAQKNFKKVLSLKNILKEENKYNIKSHCVLSKPGVDEYGHLKINQDSYLFIKEINGVKNFNIFGVLDGHGPQGHFVSQLVSRFFQLEFQKIGILNNVKDTKTIYDKLKSNKFSIIKDIFIKADIFLREQDIESRNSGTTCVLVIHIGEHIICANAGDSRAILIYDKQKKQEYKVFPLSVDSKPELKEEKERIKRMGGIVEKIKNQNGKETGPYRVWNKSREYPGLAMSRSIGDFNGKNLGIIPDPQIIETDFGININYIVVCSDGVWEFLKNDDVMNLGNKFYEENNPRGFCKEVVEYSTKCWKKEDVVIDDITMLTVFF